MLESSGDQPLRVTRSLGGVGTSTQDSSMWNWSILIHTCLVIARTHLALHQMTAMTLFLGTYNTLICYLLQWLCDDPSSLPRAAWMVTNWFWSMHPARGCEGCIYSRVAAPRWSVRDPRQPGNPWYYWWSKNPPPRPAPLPKSYSLAEFGLIEPKGVCSWTTRLKFALLFCSSRCWWTPLDWVQMQAWLLTQHPYPSLCSFRSGTRVPGVSGRARPFSIAPV